MMKVRKPILIVAGVFFLSIFLYFVFQAFQGNFTFPNEISIGPLTLRMYGLIILSAVLVSSAAFDYLIKYFLSKNPKTKKIFGKFDIYEVLIWTVVPGIIFARIVYYLSFVKDYYGGSFGDIFKVWEGGMSIFGAIIGGVIGLILYLKVKKIPLFPILDFVFIVIPLGHAVGRWANFINQEIFGPPTNLPWKMYISPEHKSSLPSKYQANDFFHPLFLYEFILNSLLFGLLFYLFKKSNKRFDGFFVCVYLIGYGLIRFLIEFIRYDPKAIFGLSIAQILSLIMVSVGAGYLTYKLKIKVKNGKS